MVRELADAAHLLQRVGRYRVDTEHDRIELMLEKNSASSCVSRMPLLFIANACPRLGLQDVILQVRRHQRFAVQAGMDQGLAATKSF